MTAPWTASVSRQPRIRVFLDRLAQAPPKSLLLEGGTEAERLGLGLYWAARLSCHEAEPPCGVCRICRQVADDAFRDLVLVNGSEGAIAIDTVREIRAMLGDPLPVGGLGSSFWPRPRPWVMPLPTPCSNPWRSPGSGTFLSSWPPAGKSCCRPWSPAASC